MKCVLILFMLIALGCGEVCSQITVTKTYSMTEKASINRFSTEENFVKFEDSEWLEISYARYLTSDDMNSIRRIYSDDMDTAFVQYSFKDKAHPYLSYIKNHGTILFQDKTYKFPFIPRVNSHEVKRMEYFPTYNYNGNEIQDVLFITPVDDFIDTGRKSFSPPHDKNSGPCEYILVKNKVYPQAQASSIRHSLDSTLAIVEYIKPPIARQLLEDITYRGCITRMEMQKRKKEILPKHDSKTIFEYMFIKGKMHKAEDYMTKINWGIYTISRVVSGSEAELEFDDPKYKSGVAVLTERKL